MITKSDIDMMSILPGIEIPESRDAHEILGLLKPIKIHSEFFILDWALCMGDNLLTTPVLPVGLITNKQNSYVVIGLEAGTPFIDCVRIDNTDPLLPKIVPRFIPYFNTRYKLTHQDIADCCHDDLKDILLATKERQYEVFYRTGTNASRADPVVQGELKKILPDISNSTPPAVELGRSGYYLTNGAKFICDDNNTSHPVCKVNVVDLAEVIRHFTTPVEEGKLLAENKLNQWLEDISYKLLKGIDKDHLQLVDLTAHRDVLANVYLGSCSSCDTPVILDVYLQLADTKSVLMTALEPDTTIPEICVRLCAVKIHKGMKYSPDIVCTINRYLDKEREDLTLEDLICITARAEAADSLL